MFHVKRFIINLLLFLFFITTSSAQYTNYSLQFKPEPKIKTQRDEEIGKNISVQSKKIQLSNEEMELIYWMDFARKYPKIFYDEIVCPYLNNYPELMKQKKYINSLKNDLYLSASLPPLVLDEKLTSMAWEHATDVKQHNDPSIAHSSTSGLNFQQRAKKFGINVCAAENLSYGASSVLMQLILLYLDIDQPGVGHRKSLLNPQFTNIGVALVRLNNKEIFFVQDFSCTSVSASY